MICIVPGQFVCDIFVLYLSVCQGRKVKMPVFHKIINLLGVDGKPILIVRTAEKKPAHVGKE